MLIRLCIDITVIYHILSQKQYLLSRLDALTANVVVASNSAASFVFLWCGVTLAIVLLKSTLPNLKFVIHVENEIIFWI